MRKEGIIMRRFASKLALLLAVLFTLSPVAMAADFTGTTVRLAQQYGMHYAPVYVMQKMGILEKHLPGATLEWSNLGGGSAMNEALISGSLDVAFMGIPPVLIAWDKGVSYKIACGISIPPSELIMRDESIKSLADIGPEDRIAVPSVGSIQHIMLSMACEKQLGDPHALDNNIVPMANPDAFMALSSGTEISGHFASMPYIDRELKLGMHSVLTAKEAYENQASIVCVTTKKLQENPAVASALMAALQEAIDLINQQGGEVMQVIADTEELSLEDADAYLNWEGATYSTDLYGVMGLASFMKANGYIKNELAQIDEIAWPGAHALN